MAWIQISALPLNNCVILGKIFNLPIPQFSYLENGIIIVLPGWVVVNIK